MKKLLLLLLGFAIGFLVAYYCFCNQNNLDNMSTPKGIIKWTEAVALDEAFNSRHQLISDSIVKRPDNRSSWWSLDDLEGFIKHAKKQADTLKYDLNGFRMYLGAHADSGKEVGYTTIFIVPTGVPSLSEGGLGDLKVGNGDIPKADGLNGGDPGEPPSVNYPQ
ncbi:hypothetical protein ACFS5M_08825 [Lacinutrix iliipiscaria]|uniref:Uncharacterized protein n=1 Tax=Lacinutrix iliipiscaria TaxID=1230532 RepID=A0ABW5WND6_9FLAO